MTGRTPTSAGRFPYAFAATVGLFAFWGLMHALYDIVVPQFNRFLGFSPLQSMLSNTSFGIVYCALAIPAALFLRRLGYKMGLLLGLCAYSVGSFLLYPAVSEVQSAYFVFSIILTAAGWALLETSANPLIVQMGPPETAVRRLNLAQAFYPLGVCIPGYLSQWITVPKLVTADPRIVEAVVRPYVVVGLALLLLVMLIEYLDFPKVARAGEETRTRARDEIRTLLARREFVLGMAAMAFVIMALVCTWSVAGRYAHHVVPGLAAASAGVLPLYMWTICGIGRIAGTALMYKYDPVRLLVICAGACVVLPVAAAATDISLGIAFILAISFFTSIMFPTVFGLTVKDLGTLTKSASGLLVASAGLGSVIGGLMMRAAGAVSALHLSLILASLCYAGVLAFALVKQREQNSRGLSDALPTAVQGAE